MCLQRDSCPLPPTEICPRHAYLAENTEVSFGDLLALLLLYKKGVAVIVFALAFGMLALVSTTIASTISGMTGRRGS